MNLRKLIAWSGLALLGLSANPALATFLPKNNLHLQDNLHKNSNIDESLFNQIIDRVLDIYEPAIQSHGASLVRNRFWDDPTVNAYAAQQGSDWVVSMYGGLARRDEVTPDGFAMVVCHELGHHLAGFPLKGAGWAASEGQADYFATHECARKIWADDFSENATYRQTVLPFVQEQCDANWSSKEDQDLCYRTASASESLANLLAALGNADKPNFATPDSAEVEFTYEAHPDAQCRLDTYFAAALCVRPFSLDTIPGKNHPDGQDSEGAELAASEVSCMSATGDVYGNRPRCWFGPKLQFLALYREKVAITELQGNGNGIAEPGEVLGLTYTLSNRTDEQTTNVSGVVSTNGPFSVGQSSVSFGDIAPGEQTENSSYVELTVNRQALCGAKGQISMRAVSDQGGSNLNDEIVIGKPEIAFAGENTTPLQIPNDATVFTEIPTDVDLLATRALVSVDIDHTYTSDVMLYLIDPSGTERFIRRLPRSGTNRIVDTYSIDLPAVATAGTWQLKVQDTYRLDDGVLNSWHIEFEHFICE